MQLQKRLLKTTLRTGFLFILVFVMTNCSSDDNGDVLSSEKKITSFIFSKTDNTFLSEDITAVIDEEAKTITATLPRNTVVTALIPTIGLSEKANVSPTGANDFSSPITYAVTAEDDSKVNYTVIVTTEVPVISNISPTNGPKTTIVTISGTNFLVEGATEVYFNNMPAEVKSVTATAITAVVPARSFTGEVKVVNDGKTLIGPEFTYLISDVQVSTFAGSGARDYIDGIGTNAAFFYPKGMAVNSEGTLYSLSVASHTVRKITSNRVVSTLAGNPDVIGSEDGTGSNARFFSASEVAVDIQGNIYVSDYGNHRVRKVTPNGVVSTLAGSTKGFANGTGTAAQFNNLADIVVDNEGNVYVVDSGNYKIRKITPNGEVSTLAGSTSGTEDGTGANAKFNNIKSIAIDVQGNLYVTDYNKIRKITPSGVVSTLSELKDETGADAVFANLNKIAIDKQGNLYVTDNHRIRKITPKGVVNTLAGSTEGFANGLGMDAKFNILSGITVDAENNIYVTDKNNNRIRKITQE